MTDATAAPSLQLENVLVALDGSELALQAMPTARALGARLGADVHTISVARDGGRVDQLRALASGALGVDIDDPRVVVVEHGEPADAIERRARELDPSVVCLTTHGRGRLGGALVGSVARTLVQRSPNPVVALGPMADNPGWTPRPRSWPEPLSVPRLVACVDGTATSEQVLPIAATWARALEMSLTILTVTGDGPTPVRQPEETRYGSHAGAEEYVEHLVQTWRNQLPATDGEVLRDPIGPASAIRLHLDQRPAGLVAVTTHARSGMQRALMGAVAASIVHASVAPCLVAPVQT